MIFTEENTTHTVERTVYRETEVDTLNIFSITTDLTDGTAQLSVDKRNGYWLSVEELKQIKKCIDKAYREINK